MLILKHKFAASFYSSRFSILLYVGLAYIGCTQYIYFSHFIITENNVRRSRKQSWKKNMQNMCDKILSLIYFILNQSYGIIIERSCFSFC